MKKEGGCKIQRRGFGLADEDLEQLLVPCHLSFFFEILFGGWIAAALDTSFGWLVFCLAILFSSPLGISGESAI